MLPLWQASRIRAAMRHDVLPQDGHHARVTVPEARHGAQYVLKHLSSP